MAPTTTPIERTAAAAIAAIVAGILLSFSLRHGMQVSTPLWLAFSVFIGIVLGTSQEVSNMYAVKRALLPSALLPSTLVGVWVVRFLRDWARDPSILPNFGPHPGGQQINTSEPLGQLLVLAFVILLFFATLLIVSLASIGKRPIVAWLVQVHRFGPEGFKRIQAIVETIVGVVTAIIAALVLLK